MYGLMVIAKIENLENAPQEIILINPPIPSVDPIASLSAKVSTPGTVIKHPSLKTIINTKVYNKRFRTSSVFKAFLIVLNN